MKVAARIRVVAANEKRTTDNKIMKTYIHALGIMAIASAFAFSQDAPPPPGGEGGPGQRGPRQRPNPEEMFKKLDADGNGSVSLEEFKAGPRGQRNPERAEQVFKKIDADQNGEVTLEEFKAHRPERMRQRDGKKKGPKPPEAPEAPAAE